MLSKFLSDPVRTHRATGTAGTVNRPILSPPLDLPLSDGPLFKASVLTFLPFELPLALLWSFQHFPGCCGSAVPVACTFLPPAQQRICPVALPGAVNSARVQQ